jgi:Holliday junction resolvase RusA-like endonuclease
LSNCTCGGAGCKLCPAPHLPKLFLPIEPMGAVRTTKAMAGKTEAGQRYATYKEHIRLLASTRLKKIPQGKAIILKDVTFFMPIPESGKTSIAIDGKRKQIKVTEGMPHTKTPDTDNLLKGLKDGLNGVAWHDDAPVYRYEGYVQKIYSDYPGIEFGIEYHDI